MNTPINNTLPLNDKDERLRKAVQGSNLVKLKHNLSEISSIAGISRSSANNKEDLIDEYLSKDSVSPAEDKQFIIERSIELGIEKLSQQDDNQAPEDIYGVILGTYLKVETDLLDEAGSLIKVWAIGQNIAKIHAMVCRYKNHRVQIHSVDTKPAKYLLDIRNLKRESLDKLFLRTDNYLEYQFTKRWSPTTLLVKYIEVCNGRLLDRISKSGVEVPISFSPHMLREKCATQTTGQNNINSIYDNIESNAKKPFFTVEYYKIYTTLIAKISTIRQFELNSQHILLTQAAKFSSDEIHIPIKHKAKGSEYLGRTYNVFCSIRSHERLQLGYIGYDMSAAMQSISLQLIKATKQDYPMLWEYANDKAFKKRIRSEIAQALAIEEDDVKKMLTAFANGLIYGKGKHPHYKAFQEESVKLRRVLTKFVYKNEPDVFNRVKEQSRKAKDLPEDLDWSDTESIETSRVAKSKSSVFFFIWTWYERKIRQAMLEILEDGIEVHDAVYSKMDIDEKVVEKAISDYTGFTITIEKEKLSSALDTVN